MSGPMPQAIAHAAGAVALRAKTDAPTYDGKLHYPKYGEPVAQAHMRAAIKKASAPAAKPAWDALPLSVRRAFAEKALGITGVYIGEKAWTDLTPQERIKIGAAARSIANALW